MNLSFWLIIFILGTFFGSFLNCIIYRLETKQSFLRGRSFCPKCHHKLVFFDLMPVLSFIFLKGKCRYCDKKISWQYVAVEIATGALFVLIFWHLGLGFDLDFGFWILDLLYLSVVSSLLIIIFVYDLKHYIILDKIIYPAIGITLGFSILNSYIINHKSFFNPLFAGLGVGIFFFLLWLVSRGKWMGLGDAKLAFFIGLFLGFPNVLAAMFLAFFIGAIMGIGLIIGGKKTLKSQVPFGPFLIAGAFLALFWGREIINWYLNLIS